MLALIFRGVFFAGVIGWYSTSMWRMIDGYFKDQFQRYLEEEYQKNPKMRDDVRVYGTVDNDEKPLADTSKQVVEEEQWLLQWCDSSKEGTSKDCTVGAAGIETSKRGDESVPPPPQPMDAFGAGAAEEVARGKEVARPVQRDEDEPTPTVREDAETCERGKNAMDVE